MQIRSQSVRVGRTCLAGALTCSRLIKLRFAYVLCFIIRKLRLAYIVCFGFLQCGIPHRFCRFYCCLAAHQRTRKKDSAEPSFPILWTPPHPPGEIRCGGAYLLPRVYRDIGFRYPVQVAHPHFDVMFGCLVFGLGLFAFQKITLGLCRSFFIGGGIGCSCLRLRWVLPWSIVELPLTATFLPILYSASPFHQLRRVQKY